MMEVILCLIATIGFTKIMVDSTMMQEVREWLKNRLPEKVLWFHPKEAVHCYQCMGTWCGFFIGVLYLLQSSSFFVFMLTNWKPWIAYVIYGFTCSLSYILLFGFASSFLSDICGTLGTLLQHKVMSLEMEVSSDEKQAGTS